MFSAKPSENVSHARCNENSGFFGGLAAEGAGFIDLGGQFLNPRHHPPLLHQRR